MIVIRSTNSHTFITVLSFRRLTEVVLQRVYVTEVISDRKRKDELSVYILGIWNELLLPWVESRREIK